ncbi:hypothetical protein B0T22DRAFT_476718 [Podospora appendiculata]|uniref:DUF302 domain-containing protein n=1 Tax=Podospora appendiculata TaxID=314037 RepID=A0AAE0XIA6_9PEZI|nr:hypothetical protein B0T22DRAFT_476718 [Podospora appendiculata]
MATRQEETYPITRVTLTIPKPYDSVLARLQSSIKAFDGEGLSILHHASSLASFEAAVESMLGPHQFMQFGAIDHGRWTGLYGVRPGRRSVRLVFGNPEIAITMIRHDYQSGLWVPVEALLVEREDGCGTDVVYVKPSTYIVRDAATVPLREAAEALDAKLEKLWAFVSEDEYLKD